MRYQECSFHHLQVKELFYFNEKHLLVVYTNKYISLYNTLTCKIEKTFENELLGDKTTAIAYDVHQQHLLLANGNVIYIFELFTQNILQIIPLYETVATHLHLLQKSNYIVVGTAQGRVELYTQNSSLSLGRLCSFPTHKKRILLGKKNYISTLSSYNHICASSGYGGDIIITQPTNIDKRIIVTTNAIQIRNIVFLEKNKLLYGNDKGELFLYHIDTQLKQKLDTSFTRIDFIQLTHNHHFCIVGSKDANFLTLVELKEFTISKHHYITCNENISHLLLINNALFITLEKTILLNYELDNSEKFTYYIQNNKLPYAYALLEENPLLAHTPSYTLLEQKYTQLYKKALNGLLKGELQELEKLKNLFFISEKHTKELLSLEKDFHYYKQLKILFQEKKYPLVLSLAQKHPHLQETPHYMKAENFFKETFLKAQKYLLINEIEKAKEILSPYLIVPTKQKICSLLLRENKTFLTFLQAVQNKEYKTIFQLLTNYEILQETASFQALQEEIETKHKNIYKALKDMDTQNMKKNIQELQHIPYLQDELKTLFSLTITIEKLLKAYENDDFIKCYELLDTHPLLEQTQLAKQLEKHWGKLLHEAEIFALDGNIQKVKQSLGELLWITTRTQTLGNILRVAFLSKIKYYLEQRLIKKAELLLYSYIDIFGSDTQLQYHCKLYEKLSNQKLAFSEHTTQRYLLNNWRQSPIMQYP